MTTTENNKLLAEFLGWGKKVNKDGEETPFYNLPIELHNHLGIIQHIPLEGFVFDTDWNWLILVVEKIESIKIESYKVRVDIYFNCCSIAPTHWQELITIYGDKETKIQAIYNACVSFVKWYNLNKQDE